MLANGGQMGYTESPTGHHFLLLLISCRYGDCRYRRFLAGCSIVNSHVSLRGFLVSLGWQREQNPQDDLVFLIAHLLPLYLEV